MLTEEQETGYVLKADIQPGVMAQAVNLAHGRFHIV